MKVAVLMENTAQEGCGLVPEHGLSLYIEYRGKRLLLDGGASGRFADNAQKLGVDLADVDLGVLSHGHYDHADGLRRFFQLNQRAKVYVRPQAGGPYFSMTEEGPKFIGVHRDIWEGARERLVPVPGPMELLEGGWLLPDGPKVPAFMGKASNLVCKRGEDDFVPDDFSHEQSLVLEGERGLVVFNSCSHGGIVNIVRGVLDQLPGKRVHAVVGGLHMYAKGGTGMNCSPEYVQSVADALKALGVERILTGHCTGQPALERLTEYFGPGCQGLYTGQVFTL